MFFRLRYEAGGLWLDIPEDQPLTIEVGGPRNITMVFRKPSAGEPGRPSWSTLCIINAEDEVAASVRETFSHLIGDGSFSDEVMEQVRQYLRGGSNEPLPTKFAYPHDAMPQDFRDYADSLHDELRDYAMRATRLLRWRLGVPASHGVSAGFNIEWSFDGDTWHAFPSGVSGGIGIDSPLCLSAAILVDLPKYILSTVDEPLAHNLYNEAEHNQFANPRSALVLAVTSIEYGIKQLISNLTPETEWLLDELQAPPIQKLLTEYIPTLLKIRSMQARYHPLPKSINRAIGDGIRLRNKVVHLGRTVADDGLELTPDKLKEVLLAVQDVLWLLDYYAGYDWALGYIRRDTLAEMDRLKLA